MSDFQLLDLLPGLATAAPALANGRAQRPVPVYRVNHTSVRSCPSELEGEMRQPRTSAFSATMR